MEYVKFTRMNTTLMTNLPEDMMEKLVNLDDVIPDDVMSAIYTNNDIYKEERNHFLDYRPDLLQKMYAARRKRRRLAETGDIINIHTDENVQFVRDYPEFKNLIDHIEFCDDNLDTVKVVPIDQYLAEN